ncbi:hypothetical protein jhhlp_001481 [Lomentospora prolificans]|uniref:Myocyte-specific enhancer factor 2d n=1 Tax=Lomentospora prolificans TaxID=41688 RepID=A0A2N3NIC3_9PEZI|nr:hypothetical protein jhhlp_001481 [Lomentospora prolificans]
MPPREIPGFYYDEAKGKYFKIENRATAPADAPWSADNVTKRKRAVKADRKRQAAEARALVTSAGKRKPLPIRRRGVLGPRGTRNLVGTVLDAECTGQSGEVEHGDVKAWLYCERLKAMGGVGIGEDVDWEKDLVGSFAVDWGGNGSALPAVYAGRLSARGRMVLCSQYIPTDRAGRVCFDPRRNGDWQFPPGGQPSLIVPEFSSIDYNPSSQVVFMAGLSNPAAFMTFTWLTPISYPPYADERPLRAAPLSAAGQTNHPAAPSPHPLLFCFAGTNSGVLALHGTGDTSWIHQTRSAGDIFSTDCHPSDPNLLLAGGRRGTVTLADLRVGPSDGAPPSFSHGTSITHLRVAPDGNPFRVAAAGLQSKMAIYDRRWLGRSPQNSALPYLPFPEYKNEVRLRVGWDVDPALGVVVAAHDDGKVGVYSAASGRRVGYVPVAAGGERSDPIGCLRLGRIGRDEMPSVLVGAGGGVLVYSCAPDREVMGGREAL